MNCGCEELSWELEHWFRVVAIENASFIYKDLKHCLKGTNFRSVLGGYQLVITTTSKAQFSDFGKRIPASSALSVRLEEKYFFLFIVHQAFIQFYLGDLLLYMIF